MGAVRPDRGPPMPDVLTKLKQADMSLDPLLNMIRAAQGRPNRRSMARHWSNSSAMPAGCCQLGELLDAQQAGLPGQSR